MNIFAATRQLAFVGKLFSAAGLKLEDFLASSDESALQAHLTSLRHEAPDTAATDTALLRAAGIELKANEKPLDALKTALAAKDFATEKALLIGAVYTAGLAQSGISVAATDAATGVTALDVHTAIDTRVSLKAAELSAQIGTRPLETIVTNEPAKAPAAAAKPKGLTGLAAVQAAFAAKLPAR